MKSAALAQHEMVRALQIVRVAGERTLAELYSLLQQEWRNQRAHMVFTTEIMREMLLS